MSENNKINTFIVYLNEDLNESISFMLDFYRAKIIWKSTTLPKTIAIKTHMKKKKLLKFPFVSRVYNSSLGEFN
ncbi:hypothetical protein LCM23_06450 [Cytobacillus kochii]|uniref:hypothetical protein n=1 Tax=Cytobacillus kochii TaxID=859143 RepID=UPI001CD4BD49|nr:hypothetical protein [Cytobacillus kochii]MCA1025726.1 hypothetical protein [Cytobacillus kochii]